MKKADEEPTQISISITGKSAGSYWWSVAFDLDPPFSSGLASSKEEAYGLAAEVLRGLAETRRVRRN